jgi:hypothetical protein
MISENESRTKGNTKCKEKNLFKVALLTLNPHLKKVGTANSVKLKFMIVNNIIMSKKRR